MASFIIFDPKKVPAAASPELASYGEDSVETLIITQNTSLQRVYIVLSLSKKLLSLQMSVQNGKHTVN